ncbi:MAG: helix-turn-helix domain-containing protein [Lachnospiraceae bacterium]|nr:helix-turn-helix domain-containing protein [Lachnospiraceae bacterium]
MTAIAPEVKPLGRYATKEVCEMLEIHRNSLLRYVTEGIISPLPKKPGTKVTRYLGRDIIKLWKQKT